MKCVRCKKLIYLYDELNAKEKQIVDEHLASCQLCQLHLQQAREEKHFLKSVFTTFNAPDNVSLADEIMQSIRRKSSAEFSVVELIFLFLRQTLIRYSMAVISAVLCIFFITEVLHPSSKLTVGDAYRADSRANEAGFNSMYVYDSIAKTHKGSEKTIHVTAFSLYECIRNCNNNNRKNCIDCKAKYLKLKGYESI
jgi:hypothetical protein